MKTAQQKVINSVLIETPFGLRTFELVLGDVTAHAADLLVISTHHNAEMQPTGRVLSSFQQRFGSRIEFTQPWLSVLGGITSYIASPPESAHFNRILIMRIARTDRQPDPADFYDQAIRGTFASIAALEFMGEKFTTISLPVLSGQRITDYPRAVESLLHYGVGWLKRSIHVRRIRYYVFSDTEITAWDEAMNACLGRSYVNTGNESILRGLCNEIVHWIDTFETCDEPFRSVLSELRGTLSHPDRVSPQLVAMAGRKLAEHITESVCKTAQLTIQKELVNNIEALRKTKVADWILSYLHSLRVFGNEAVHALAAKNETVPSQLQANDLISILSAIRSVTTFWEQWPKYHRATERTGVSANSAQ